MLKKLSVTLPLLLLLVLSIPAFSKILRPGFFPMHDDIQVMRVFEMNKCFLDLQIPCRWVPDMGYGYGYPQFNYYGPAPYYLMEMVHLVGFSFIDSVKFVFILSVILSGIGMYLFAGSIWGKWGGFISALLYIYVPYRAVDMYVRGAVGEFCALAILPFIFWSSRLVMQGKGKSLVLTLSLFLLLVSHNVTALIFLPFYGLWTLLHFSKNVGKLKEFIVANLLGFGASAFFILPAFFEKSMAHTESMISGYFNYLAHFVGLKQLFGSTFWGYGSSEIGQFDDLFLGVGLLHWLIPIIVVILSIVFVKRKQLKYVVFLIFCSMVSIFMTHSKSVFIWNSIPLLSYLQFPWRFLLLSSLFLSTVSGGIITFFSSQKSRVWLTIGLAIAIAFLYLGYFRPGKWLNITDNDKLSGQSWELQRTISIFDYLPTSAKYPPADPAPSEPKSLDGTVNYMSTESGSDWKRWKVGVLTDKAILRLPIIYFPDFKVWIDGVETNFKYDNELGLMDVDVSGGNHEIYAKLTNTPVRTLGNVISLISIGIIVVWFKRKRNVESKV